MYSSIIYFKWLMKEVYKWYKYSDFKCYSNTLWIKGYWSCYELPHKMALNFNLETSIIPAFCNSNKSENNPTKISHIASKPVWLNGTFFWRDPNLNVQQSSPNPVPNESWPRGQLWVRRVNLRSLFFFQNALINDVFANKKEWYGCLKSIIKIL